MRDHFTSQPRIRLRTYLAVCYALFIVYASLSPFTGWQEQGLDFIAVLSAPLRQTYTWFDMVVNILAYFPFGLLFGLILRTRLGIAGSLILATMGGILLSGGLEYAQMYLPSRASSNLDLLANSTGTLAGVLLAASIASSEWFALNLTLWRTRIFYPHVGRDFGMALIVLWLFAQTNPSLPILGNVFINEVARPLFEVPLHEPFRWLESTSVALNLLMLGSLLMTLMRQRHHALGFMLLIIGIVALLKFITAAVLLESWALLLWLNREGMYGILVGALLLLAISNLPRNRLLWFSAATSLVYLLLTYWLVDSSTPSSSMRMYQWSYGHLLNYNGLSQVVLMIFPLLLLGYLWRVRNR